MSPTYWKCTFNTTPVYDLSAIFGIDPVDWHEPTLISPLFPFWTTKMSDVRTSPNCLKPTTNLVCKHSHYNLSHGIVSINPVAKNALMPSLWIYGMRPDHTNRRQWSIGAHSLNHIKNKACINSTKIEMPRKLFNGQSHEKDPIQKKTQKCPRERRNLIQKKNEILLKKVGQKSQLERV